MIKKISLLVLVCGVLLAQKETKPKIDHCGLGSLHHCHCVERVDRIQVKAAEVCNGPDWRNYYKTRDECYRQTLKGLDHCSIAEHFTQYDGEDLEYSEQRGEGKSEMGQLCAMACRKHRCFCNDGPVCNFGMSADEIKEANKEK